MPSQVLIGATSKHTNFDKLHTYTLSSLLLKIIVVMRIENYYVLVLEDKVL